MPGSQMEFYGMELRPIKPASLGSLKDATLIQDSGDYITWYEDGTVTKLLADGTLKTWHPCPTLADAIDFSGVDEYECPDSRKFFQFHRDGSVTSYWYGAPYFWSAPIYQAEEEKGVVVDV